jgi:hypothetical protein
VDFNSKYGLPTVGVRPLIAWHRDLPQRDAGQTVTPVFPTSLCRAKKIRARGDFGDLGRNIRKGNKLTAEGGDVFKSL